MILVKINNGGRAWLWKSGGMGDQDTIKKFGRMNILEFQISVFIKDGEYSQALVMNGEEGKVSTLERRLKGKSSWWGDWHVQEHAKKKERGRKNRI